MKKIRDSRGARKWFRDNVHNWKEDEVVIFYLSGSFNIVISFNNKPKVTTCYHHYFPFLVPKFIEFFDTGKWDDRTYWKLYNDKGEFGDIYSSSSNEDLFSFLSNYREKDPDVGVKEVLRPENSEYISLDL